MNPMQRPWDRPLQSYLVPPSVQSQYLLGNNPLNLSTQYNSSAVPVTLNQMPAASKPVQTVAGPPALPPRINGLRRTARLASRYRSALDTAGYGGYGSYGRYGSYGGYGGYSGYGGLGGYGSYGGYGGGYGGYGSYSGYGGYGMYGPHRTGNPNDPEDQFIRLAEESSRPAFQSIESLVQAFHSVSMMLDSTLGAVHTLFRAVLGMADNFGRMRSLLKQFFGSVALFRLFLWTYRKLLYLVGVRKSNPNREEIWKNAAAELGNQINQELGPSAGRQGSAWPILLFLGIVFSGPYLILKFINSLNPAARRNDDEVSSVWNPMEQPGHLRVALYDYAATSEDELSFRAGERIIVAPANLQTQGGWLLACIGSSPQVGLVPGNYLAKPRLPGQLRSIARSTLEPQPPLTTVDGTFAQDAPIPVQPAIPNQLPSTSEQEPALVAPILPEPNPVLPEANPLLPEFNRQEADLNPPEVKPLEPQLTGSIGQDNGSSTNGQDNGSSTNGDLKEEL